MSLTLVTGANGFVGRYLVEALIEKKTTVRVFTRNSKSLPPAWSSQVEIVEGDLLELAEVNKAIAGVERVFHLAALTGRRNVQEKPQECLDTTILGTRNLLTACLKVPVQEFNFSSSAEVERYPLSSYAIAKLAAESYITAMLEKSQVGSHIFRLVNVFGPGQSTEFVIPLFITQLLQGQTLKVDSNQKRWFIPVEEAVNTLLQPHQEALIRVGEDLPEVTIAELAELLTRIHQGNKPDHVLAPALRRTYEYYRSRTQ